MCVCSKGPSMPVPGPASDTAAIIRTPQYP